MPVTEELIKPDGFSVEEETATETYAKIVSEPWEKGYGHTIGNAMRRVLLSSLEGVAPASIRIDGVSHEFSSMDNVLEDVTEIVLNVKGLKFQCDGELPRTLELRANKAGRVTASKIKEDGVTTVLNPELLICRLDKDRDFRMEIEIDKARGYRPAEQNKKADQPIGVIPVDSMGSPVERVRYEVQACRVAQRTDLDRLVMEIWSDGRVSPTESFTQAARILMDQMRSLLPASEHPSEATEEQPEEESKEGETQGADQEEKAPAEEETAPAPELSAEQQQQLQSLLIPLDDVQLSARARNSLKSAGIVVLGQMVEMKRSELLQHRRFGRKSLEDIRAAMQQNNIDLGMTLSDEVRDAMHKHIKGKKQA